MEIWRLKKLIQMSFLRRIKSLSIVIERVPMKNMLFLFVGFSIIGKAQNPPQGLQKEINFKIKGTGLKNIIVDIGIGSEPGAGNCCTRINPNTIFNFFGKLGDGIYDGNTRRLITKIHQGMDGTTIDLSKFYPMKGNNQDEKIRELERKIATMEGKTIPVPQELPSPSSDVDTRTLGKFQFSKMEYDFGTIKSGQIIEHVFNFVNTGQAPLVISNITSSCVCAVPDWTKTSVQPGKMGFVKVVFNSTNKNGAQSPTVTIQANTDPAITRLSMRGSVVLKK